MSAPSISLLFSPSVGFPIYYIEYKDIIRQVQTAAVGRGDSVPCLLSLGEPPPGQTPLETYNKYD